MLGLPLDEVEIRIGDSSLPQCPVEGGLWTAASAGSAVMQACEGVRQQILKHAQRIKNSPLKGAEPADIEFVEGKITTRSDPSRRVPLKDVLREINEAIKSKVTSMPIGQSKSGLRTIPIRRCLPKSGSTRDSACSGSPAS